MFVTLGTSRSGTLRHARGVCRSNEEPSCSTACSDVAGEATRTDVRARVLDLLRTHGWNATSFQILERGFSYWFDAEADACVAYADTGRAWVAAGAPIASPSDLEGAGARFIAAARAAGRRVCFFAVEDRFCRSTALASMPIGEQPSWDPTVWPSVVAGDRRLREQLRRALAKRVSVRALEPTELAEGSRRASIEALVKGWLAKRKMAKLGFLVDVQLFDFAVERRCFLAEREGSVVGLLVAVPVYSRGGWLFEDLLRAEAAPNGTSELLIDAAMRAVGREGSSYVTLGLAPLAGDLPVWLRLFRTFGAALYDFDGLRRFKGKLRPRAWTPIHLAWPNGASSNLAVFDALSAFTMRPRDGHDRASFIRFGAETLAHAPSFAVRVLAVLLVGWTFALALAPTVRFFPSRDVHLAWVGWDVGLIAAMFVLAARWRRGLARGLALATLLDALLTVLEVLLDAQHRARSVFDAALIGLACVGPVLATSLLWGALHTRRAAR